MNIWLNIGLLSKFCPEFSDGSSCSFSIVRERLRVRLGTIIENLDRRISLNLEPLTKSLFDCSIDLTKFNLSLKILCSLSILWLKGLAVSTPRCIKLYDPDVFGLCHESIKISLIQDNDLISESSSGLLL
jgi:hypothetical protein